MPCDRTFVAEVAYLVEKFAGSAAEIQFMEAVRDDVFHQEEPGGQDFVRVNVVKSEKISTSSSRYAPCDARPSGTP
jgi:hypothetical protein